VAIVLDWLFENENSTEEINDVLEKSLTFDDSAHVKCDECGKICKKRGLNAHKAVHKKTLIKITYSQL